MIPDGCVLIGQFVVSEGDFALEMYYHSVFCVTLDEIQSPIGCNACDTQDSSLQHHPECFIIMDNLEGVIFVDPMEDYE